MLRPVTFNGVEDLTFEELLEPVNEYSESGDMSEWELCFIASMESLKQNKDEPTKSQMNKLKEMYTRYIKE